MNTQTKFDKVMIIDDNSIDLYITSRMITSNNFGKTVLQYSSAQQAFNYLEENHQNPQMLPAIILVDIYMPVMSGFEFMEAYDSLPQSFKNHCLAFIISSSIDESDISRANNDKNVVAFQEKPITRQFLENIVSSLQYKEE